jgi:hypothetical protein
MRAQEMRAFLPFFFPWNCTAQRVNCLKLYTSRAPGIFTVTVCQPSDKVFVSIAYLKSPGIDTFRIAVVSANQKTSAKSVHALGKSE